MSGLFGTHSAIQQKSAVSMHTLPTCLHTPELVPVQRWLEVATGKGCTHSWYVGICIDLASSSHATLIGCQCTTTQATNEARAMANSAAKTRQRFMYVQCQKQGARGRQGVNVLTGN